MRYWCVAAVCVSAALPLGSVEAQRPISVSLAGGVSLPQGDFAAAVGTGWHALGVVALSTLMQPIGLRLDVAYNRFSFDVGGGHQTVSSATLNGTYRLPMTNSPMSPYLISGLGAYRTECSLATGCDAATKFGWNVGLGTKLFVGFRSFVEARYHRTNRAGRAVGYFPLTLGVTF